MKKILILLVIIKSSIVISQNQTEVPKYNAKNDAGIFYYNKDEVVKKSKIKKKNEIYKVNKIIRSYNDKIKKISFLKSPDLNGLDLFVNSFGIKRFRDQETSLNVQNKIDEIIVPIKDSIAKHESDLNKSMKAFLSKKQFKKWLKYQRKEKLKVLNNGKQVKINRPPNLNRVRRQFRNYN